MLALNHGPDHLIVIDRNIMTPSKEKEDTGEGVDLRTKMILTLNILSLRLEFGELLRMHRGAWRGGYALT